MSGFLDSEENFEMDSRVAIEVLVELLAERFQSERYSKEYIADRLRKFGDLCRAQGGIQALQELKNEQDEKKKQEESEN